MDIREFLKNNRIITDGSMGTYYESLVKEPEFIVEKANEYDPGTIKNIHLEYIKSEAQLIRTNTFATNTLFFYTKEAVIENIKKGYNIAKEAVEESGKDIIIAADIGPIYETGEKDENEIIEEYKYIIDTFIEEGAQVFVFETYSILFYMEEVTKYIKEKKEDAFVIVQCTFDRSGYTKLGMSIKRMIKVLSNMDGVDAYGMNCGVAPTHMLEFLEKVEFPNDKYITALPNSSYPVELRGKTVYSENVKHYVEVLEKIAALGIDIVGGCCGTTPKHIELLTKRLKNTEKNKKKIKIGKSVKSKDIKEKVQKNIIVEKLENNEKVFVVELDPPFDQDSSKVMEGAQLLKEAKVDAITLSDSPLARARADATHLGIKIQNKTGVPVIAHLTCRDKNIIGLRSILLGAHINKLRNFLVVTGDPIAQSDRELYKSVFEFNSINLMNYIKGMNEDFLKGEEIVYGGALNYHGVNVEKIAERMIKKMEAGAKYFLTQPIYTDDDIERIRLLKEMTNAKILCGIMPLVSYKNASFIKNEMPGINVSDEIMEQYHPDMTRDESERTAIRISVDIGKKLYPFADGFYFITPFNRVYLICSILEQIKAMNQ